MAPEQHAVPRLYAQLLRLYPRAFRQRVGESMQQTFVDLYQERQRQTAPGRFGFVVWIFLETASGIFRERLRQMTQGGVMQSITQPLKPAGIVSFLLILPLAIMQIVNRRHFQEDFPTMLFLGMWLTLLALCLIVLPIVQGWRTGKQALTPPANTLLTNPKATALTSVGLMLFFVLFFGLNSLGWAPLQRLLNGPNPAVFYLPGQIIALSLIALPIAAGIIAGGPVVRTLRSGGSLLAHPLHLLLVVLISSLLALGFVFLLMDQWPCFVGVPNCD